MSRRHFPVRLRVVGQERKASTNPAVREWMAAHKGDSSPPRSWQDDTHNQHHCKPAQRWFINSSSSEIMGHSPDSNRHKNMICCYHGEHSHNREPPDCESKTSRCG